MTVIEDETGYEVRVVEADELAEAGEKRSRRVYVDEAHLGMMGIEERARRTDLEAKTRFENEIF